MRRTPPPSRGRGVEDAEPVLQDLERTLERARHTLDDQHSQEADLRDRLYELKQADDAANPFWLVIDISRSSAYATTIRECRELLLSRAKALNPQLTSWEKAIDPTWKVSEISTRSGKKKVRPFQPPLPLLKVLQAAGRAAETEMQEREEVSVTRGPSAETQDLRSALRVPMEPKGSENPPHPNQPPVGAGSRHGAEERLPEPMITREMVMDIQETVAGMKRFLAEMGNRERCSESRGPSEELVREPRGAPRRREEISLQRIRVRPCTLKEERNPLNLPQSPWASRSSPADHPISFLDMVGATEKEKVSQRAQLPDFSRPPPALPEEEEEDESLAYFKRMYEEECEEIEEIDL